MFGKPTWRRLVEVVEDPVGGNDPALAQKIARDHPGKPGIVVSNYKPIQKIKCELRAQLALWYLWTVNTQFL